MSTTAHYSWTKPTVNGDSGTWGTTLNATLDAIDAALFSVSGGTDGALPKSGGVMTGRADLLTTTFKRVDKGSVSGATPLDLSAAQYFSMTVTGPTTISLTNAVSTGVLAQGFVMRIVNGGSAAITWPASFRFPGGSAPSLTTAGTDVLVAISDDNGSTWRATIAMKDVK